MNVAQDLALTVERARISKGATDATASQASWENIVKRVSGSKHKAQYNFRDFPELQLPTFCISLGQCSILA